MNKSRILLVGVIALLLSLPGCGGGSDGDNNSGDGDFAFNACDAVGLKVANGEACQPAGATDSPIVRLIIDDSGLCTGTVIAPNAVLTAAHCFIGGASQVRIDTFNGTVQGTRVVTNPQFGVDEAAQIFYNDSAIVLTSTTIPVRTAPLLVSRAVRVGEESVVAGFGETAPGEGSGFIHAGNAIVKSVTVNHIFINFVGDQAHPCRGDSGGALFVRQGAFFAIAGVVSQSDPSVNEDGICRKGDMTLYSNIQSSSILGFIQSVVPNASGI